MKPSASSGRGSMGWFSRLGRVADWIYGLPAIAMSFFAAPAAPTRPHRVPFLKAGPKGLRLIHSAPSPSEGEFLRQILLEEGFHVEFVPSVCGGVFGITGNSDIYVREDQADQAIQFLEQYLSGEIEQTGEDE